MRRTLILLMASGFLAMIASSAAAQATLAGLVRDSSGRPIAGAEVAIEALSRVTHADQKGHYLLDNISPGVRLVRVRRIGFSQFSRMVQIAAGENAMNDVVLSAVVTKLDTVVTRDQMLMREDPLLREFEENRKIGLGHFVTRAELSKQEGREMAQIVSQFSGIRISRVPTQPRVAYVESSRKHCHMQVYLDYTLMSRWEPFDINTFPPAQIESIEYFAGPAQTPQRYSGLGSQCGVVVLHTRRPP